VSPLEAVLVALAGVAAGTINTVVGSGTLITFPTLLAFGVPPVTANVSNTIGLVPGSISGAAGYRRELSGQRARMLHLASASASGGLVGGILLLAVPDAFEVVVPGLIALGILLVIAGPRISEWVAARHEAAGGLPHRGAWWVWPGMFACGIYGGYFGAAQGILLLGILGLALPDDLQRVNALKNVLAGAVNGVAADIFIAVADVAWGPAALIAAGSIVGAQLAARYGRRLSPQALRAVIVAVGIAAIVQLVT
jgi:uncharacterized membrane protein YfcA